jgi:hypothetical protein
VPSPKKGENLSQYVGRFMGSGEAEKSFPKRKQRLAVAYSMFARRKKKK